MQVTGGGEENAIAVDYAAGGIAEQGAVGVSVESYAEVEPAFGFGHEFAQGFGVQRSAAFVDIFSVGRDVDESRLNAKSAKQFGSFGCGCAVGAINQHAQFA